jgi:hypothetical protein
MNFISRFILNHQQKSGSSTFVAVHQPDAQDRGSWLPLSQDGGIRVTCKPAAPGVSALKLFFVVYNSPAK